MTTIVNTVKCEWYVVMRVRKGNADLLIGPWNDATE